MSTDIADGLSAEAIRPIVRETIREALRANRAALALALERRRPSHLTRIDRGRLGAILPAIAGAIGSELFTALEATEHESPALRIVLEGLNARSLGRLLRRAQ